MLVKKLDMKENGKMIDKKLQELRHGVMDLIQGSLNVDKKQEKENLNMLMEVIIMGIF